MKQRNREVQLDLFGEYVPKHRLRVVFSNDMVELAKRLGEEFFLHGSSPFEQRIIVVPDMAMKEFLFRCFVAHPRLQMAAGMQVYVLNQAVMEIGKQHKQIPSFLELSLAIEEKLHGLSLDSRKKMLKPLTDYLKADSEEKKKRRISSLSEEVAKLFARYGLHGVSFLPKWLSQKRLGWQQLLWKELFSEESPWTFPLATGQPKQFPGKLSLFGFSYLAPVHINFFSSLNACFYQLSPCALFWEDMVSDRERLKFGNLLKKREAKENFREEIDQYMQQGHPLLGNLGKLGREMLKALDGFELAEEEVYQEPEGSTMLACLKRSLLHLDEAVTSVDDSIQVHSATSRLREVEILRDFLETHMQSNGDIDPSEILVASPNIASYAPYIQIVFGESSFPFSIHEIPIFSISPTVQGFLQLLKLKEERFALASVVKLLQCKSFLEKNGWTHGEIDVLCKWMKHAEVREKLSSHPNSWEAGIDRLLYGLAFIPGEQPDPNFWPIPCISMSEIDLFNRFLELFGQLETDLASLDSERSVTEWMDFFLQIGSKYFHLDGERESFFQQIKQLSISCRQLKQRVWNFESVGRILQQLAHLPAGQIDSCSKLQKITFTSLCHGNLRAARILWCLGMDEGSFPRTDTRRSLCEMARLKSPDYYPNRADEDRALFLDFLIKTQDTLVFSYQRLNSADGKQQGPSILLEELVQYLGITSHDHPAFAFDQSYFSPDAKIKRWGESDFLAAKAFYLGQGKTHPLLSHCPEREDVQDISIDVRQLKKLARHPLQFYFNETLKIFLKEEEDEEEKEFLISFLRKSILRKKALKISPQQMVHQLQAAGKLPQGLFQEAAWQEVEEEVENLIHHLNAFGVKPEEVQTVLLPMFSIPVGTKKVHITGKLEDVTPQGLLFHGENDLKNLVKAWPLYLIYLCLGHKSTRLLFTKSGDVRELLIENPQAALASYLEYYLLAKNNLSPLMPDWADALLRKSEIELLKAMSNEFSQNDVYLSYLYRRQGMLDAKEVFQLWSPPLRKSFNTLLGVHNDV